MKTLRQYQTDLSINAVKILNELKLVYLACEVRTGKTATSLETAKLYGATNVLFLTKKKAIKSILTDYKDFGYTFNITVINNESLHTINGNYDLIISDEHHRIATYPKPNKIAKLIKQRYANVPMIFLSGTPTPESYSQIFHQYWISNYSPFKHANFYRWAKDFVTVKQVHLGYATVNDYSNANKQLIDTILKKYTLTFTQKEAGFTSEVNEKIIYIDASEYTHSLAKRLTKEKIINGKNEIIIADTGAKLLTKLHQIWSGTVKFESGNTMVLDYSKANYIFENFKNKTAIFYKFQAELDALKEVFKNTLTTDLTEFDNSDKHIALQIVSGREGISLKNAKQLVYYNIDFSAVSYWQSRDRLTTMDRLTNDVYYIFAKNGIESKIYKSVLNKKNYTLSVFKKESNIVEVEVEVEGLDMFKKYGVSEIKKGKNTYIVK